MTDKEKLEKIKVLADAMYNAAFNITTDASRLKKAMYDYHQFVIQELRNEEPVSEDLEEAAMRIATRHSHITGDTYYANDAWFFKKGAQWQKQQLIEKACEWLKSYRQDTYDGTGYIAGIVNDKTIEEFRQAMEE